MDTTSFPRNATVLTTFHQPRASRTRRIIDAELRGTVVSLQAKHAIARVAGNGTRRAPNCRLIVVELSSLGLVSGATSGEIRKHVRKLGFSVCDPADALEIPVSMMDEDACWLVTSRLRDGSSHELILFVQRGQGLALRVSGTWIAAMDRWVAKTRVIIRGVV